MKYKIRYNPIVYEDLKEIKNYIALDSEDTAKKVVKDIIDKIDNLVNFPNSATSLNAKLRKKISPDYKFILIKNYYVFYYLTDDIINVCRVIYSKRDYTRILQFES